MNMYGLPCQLPSGTIQEYMSEEGGLSVDEFFAAWVKAGRPQVQTVWRDPEGGWIRWLWFGHEGVNHALFIPSLRKTGGDRSPEFRELARASR